MTKRARRTGGMGATRSAGVLLAAVAAAAIAACSGGRDVPRSGAGGDPPVPVTSSAQSNATGIFPDDSGGHHPSLLGVNGKGLDGAFVTETESCAGCHADAAAQWQSSAHAFGSFNNPVYRVAVDRIRKDLGNEP